MQLHPFYATISRPVYHDRAGFLYLSVKCPECGGCGTREASDKGLAHPSSREITVECETCGGEGQVYEEVAEDEL